MKIFVYFVGKPRDPRANAISADFIKRASYFAPILEREIRPDRFDLFAKHPAARKVFLDPTGKQLDSAQFSTIVRDGELRAHDLVFLIGGHDGLPAELRPRADILLALSKMTFPHELARAILAEQIYRAFTILRGHPYPR